MRFKKLTDEETMKLDALLGLQKTLARAELAKALAKLRLEFDDQAKKEIEYDPWFRDQDESVQIAIMASIAERHAEEFSRLAEAQVWLLEVPPRISNLRRTFGYESLEGRLHG